MHPLVPRRSDPAAASMGSPYATNDVFFACALRSLPVSLLSALQAAEVLRLYPRYTSEELGLAAEVVHVDTTQHPTVSPTIPPSTAAETLLETPQGVGPVLSSVRPHLLVSLSADGHLTSKAPDPTGVQEQVTSTTMEVKEEAADSQPQASQFGRLRLTVSRTLCENKSIPWANQQDFTNISSFTKSRRVLCANPPR